METESQMLKTNMVTRGKGEWRINWETGIDMYTLPCIKQITNDDSVQQRELYIQYSVMIYMEKEYKRKWIYVYV